MGFLIVPVLALCIPIVAIAGSFYYKIKVLELKKYGGLNTLNTKQLLDEVEQLRKENKNLHKRIENLEVITTSKDWDALLPPNKHDDPAKEIDKIANKIKGKS